MNPHLLGRAVLLAGLCLAATAHAYEETDPAKIGLPVGAHAPSFTVSNQDGQPVSLDSLLKQGPVALVFFRSADWCGYCKLQLVDLQHNLKEIEATGAHVAGISYDPVDVLKRFAQRSAISFPLLSDAGSKTIDAYAVRKKDAPEPFAGMSYHAMFIIDRRGVIRERLFQVSYKERPAVDALLRSLRQARELNLAGNPPLRN